MEATENSERGQPLAVPLSDQLGLVPERAAFEAAAEAKGLPLALDQEWHPLGKPETERPYYAARTNAAWWAWQVGRAAERERCAKVCEELETSVWRTYKNGGAANQHTEGRSDGAGECASLIRGS